MPLPGTPMNTGDGGPRLSYMISYMKRGGRFLAVAASLPAGLLRKVIGWRFRTGTATPSSFRPSPDRRASQ